MRCSNKYEVHVLLIPVRRNWGQQLFQGLHSQDKWPVWIKQTALNCELCKATPLEEQNMHIELQEYIRLNC